MTTTELAAECPQPTCGATIRIPQSMPNGVYRCKCQGCEVSLSWAHYQQRGRVPALRLATVEEKRTVLYARCAELAAQVAKSAPEGSVRRGDLDRELRGIRARLRRSGRGTEETAMTIMREVDVCLNQVRHEVEAMRVCANPRSVAARRRRGGAS